MIQVTLQTNRLTLVPLGDEHLEYEIFLDANPDVMRYLGAGKPRERSEVEKHHKERVDAARNGLGFWAGFLGADFVGWWLLAPADEDERGQAELGYRLLPDFWRQGLASEGAAALLAYGFEDVGLTQVFAETMAVNAGSRAVMSRLRLTYLGTRGEGANGPVPGSDQGTVDYAITKDRWAAFVH
ncbi:GNAT family N-acetyltransferase [Cryobacterium fucosi]|uniref:N-acetyltransferase n=1 Tax=Cryobacterium fucosi TaxID=1259157 RepID=A0A4R9B925_9MICO|nr:GNAT family N-acetyltransferase [Cryobacterium fucosi]TFD76982.1 N-acetyltransferase [Cryobacterium fucosi]